MLSSPTLHASNAVLHPIEVENLPVFPAVALELMNLIDSDDSSVHDIMQLLRREPSLSAEILRVSNTARYVRHKKEIVDLDTALVVIGLATARKVSLNAAIQGMLGRALGLPELRQCWSHCIAVAVVAEELAADHDVPAGAAYVAGLLHDIGMLALLCLYPSEYQQMLIMMGQKEMGWREAERKIFGRDHQEVGALVLTRMGLPASLLPVVEQHHDWADLSASGMLPLIATSDKVAGALGFGVGEQLSKEALAELFGTIALANPQRGIDGIHGLRNRIQEAMA